MSNETPLIETLTAFIQDKEYVLEEVPYGFTVKEDYDSMWFHKYKARAALMDELLARLTVIRMLIVSLLPKAAEMEIANQSLVKKKIDESAKGLIAEWQLLRSLVNELRHWSHDNEYIGLLTNALSNGTLPTGLLDSATLRFIERILTTQTEGK